MVKKQEGKFNKKQILSSNRFKTIEKDVLNAILEDKEYSLEDVKTVLKEFSKKEVSK